MKFVTVDKKTHNRMRFNVVQCAFYCEDYHKYELYGLYLAHLQAPNEKQMYKILTKQGNGYCNGYFVNGYEKTVTVAIIRNINAKSRLSA